MTVKRNWKLVSSELKLHKKINYAYYQKIVVSYVWLSVYKRQFYQIVELNRKIDSSAWIELNYFFPESECSNIRLQKCCELENRVRGPSRSLEISPFIRAHRLHTDGLEYLWRYLVLFLRYSIFKSVVTLKTGSEVTQLSQGHWKLYHSIDCVRFPISVLY